MTSFDGSAPPPHSVEAERSALGACLLSATAFHRIAGIVRAEDFFRAEHKVTFRAMGELAADGREIDLVSLWDELKREGRAQEAGGGAYVASLTDGIPDVANVEDYARIIKRLSRQLHNALIGTTLQRDSLDPTIAPEEAAAAALRALAEEAGGENQSRHMYEEVMRVERQRIANLSAGVKSAIRTGFKRHDHLGIIRRGCMTIVAAPSGHGKSTEMRNLATGILRADESQRVAYYSLEERAEEFQIPLLCQMGGILKRRMKDRTLTASEDASCALALDELRSWKDKERFFFADRIREFEMIHADARRLKASSGLSAIFVDFAQLVAGFEDQASNRTSQADRIGRGFALLAQDLDIAVIIGSQVNKERERRTSGRLRKEDMKNCSALAEHATSIAMFQRPREDDKANKELPWCQVVYQIEKNRGDETGDITMHADMPTATMSEGTCEENNCRWNRPPSEPQLKLGGK